MASSGLLGDLAKRATNVFLPLANLVKIEERSESLVIESLALLIRKMRVNFNANHDELDQS